MAQCHWRPRPIDNPRDIRETRLIITTARQTFGIYNNCVTLLRREVGDELSFALVNRFNKGIGVKTAYAVVKSTRTFTNTPPIKISLSRGSGWVLRDKTAKSPAPQREMFYEPFKGTVETWNAAHAADGTPEELAQRLGVEWHAYTEPDLGRSSTEMRTLWQIEESFDLAHDVSTHYLLRFVVNTERDVSRVQFQVFLQPQIKRVVLNIRSSIDALSGDYEFNIQ